jgi:lysophospholipase L1-like esterase
MGERSPRKISPKLAWVMLASIVAIAGSMLIGVVPASGGIAHSIWGEYALPFVEKGLFQIGVVVLCAAAFLQGCRFFSLELAENAARQLSSLAIGLAIGIAAAFLSGEIFLRIFFHDGMTFSEHVGPIVRTYERNIRWNRFEGPSRGPETIGPKTPGVVRILIQGDSITWGQGVRAEEEVYPARLLHSLRRQNPQVEMAVFAECGRDIDEHLAVLRRDGPEVDPDLIVYQWFVNDLEVATRGLRPRPWAPWNRLFFHRILKQGSYLYFFLDYQANNFLAPRGEDSYPSYLLSYFEEDTPQWNDFAAVFRTWVAEAKSMTPRVLVVLSPSLAHQPFLLGEVHRRMRELGETSGVVVLDLAEREFIPQELRGFVASRYDPHPNSKLHARIAELLEEEIRARWPELFSGKAAAVTSGET